VIEKDNSQKSLRILNNSQSLRWQLAGLLFWIVELVAIFHVATANWLQFSWDYDHYSHLVVIPLISSYLLYASRRSIFGVADTSPAPGTASLIALLGLGQILASRIYGPALNDNDGLAIAMAGVVTLVLAGYIGFLGYECARAARFPLGFLFLAVPLPSLLLDDFIRVLQYGSAQVADLLFQAFGIPVLREGLVFALPRVSIEVAKECSGIRSSMALLILALLCAYFFLHTTSRRIVLILLSVPLLVLKNGIRIVVLTVLAEYVDPSFLTGNLHRDGGIVFFVVTFAIFGVLLRFLARSESKPPRLVNAVAIALPLC
jgi:exosortase